MKPTWLIEPEVFSDDNLEGLIKALDRSNTPYVEIEFGKSYQEYINIPYDDKVVVHGSVQLANVARRLAPRWHGLFYNLPEYNCNYYYPRFGQYLLNQNYVMLPVGDLERRKDFMFFMLSATAELFVRPNAATKPFTGQIISRSNWTKDMKLLMFYDVEPEELVVLASPKKIDKEWRLIVVDDQIVTGSQYRDGTNYERIPHVPDAVLQFGETVLKESKYKPDRAWMLDICQTDHLHVLEVGPFSSCAMYAADPELVVEAINQSIMD